MGSEYVVGLEDGGETSMLPGGRYACAKVLVSRHIPCLEGRSLGQVCHIVQLAISDKKILGYDGCSLVPYAHSRSKLKDRCAEQQTALAVAAPHGLSTDCSAADSHLKTTGASPLGLAAQALSPERRVATWPQALELVRQIVGNAQSQGTNGVPISNVKRLFLSKYQIELSETALGHSKLSDLLRDARMQAVCQVRQQGHASVVVPVHALQCVGGTVPRGDMSRPHKWVGDEKVGSSTDSSPSPSSVPGRQQTQLLLADVDVGVPTSVGAKFTSVFASPLGLPTRNGFIQFTADLSPRRRASSVPKDFGSVCR